MCFLCKISFLYCLYNCLIFLHVTDMQIFLFLRIETLGNHPNPYFVRRHMLFVGWTSLQRVYLPTLVTSMNPAFLRSTKKTHILCLHTFLVVGVGALEQSTHFEEHSETIKTYTRRWQSGGQERVPGLRSHVSQISYGHITIRW
jgi:hypothetical protein